MDDYGMEQAERHGREIGVLTGRIELLHARARAILELLSTHAVIEVCLAPENESARSCIEAVRKEARHALDE